MCVSGVSAFCQPGVPAFFFCFLVFDSLKTRLWSTLIFIRSEALYFFSSSLFFPSLFLARFFFFAVLINRSTLRLFFFLALPKKTKKAPRSVTIDRVFLVFWFSLLFVQFGFLGSLHPSIQDGNGRPKRDPSTIIQILRDLLSATNQQQFIPEVRLKKFFLGILF